MARILLTGATSGIGLAAASQLASEPHEVVIHGPEPEGRAVEAVERIRRSAHPGARVSYAQADFTDPDGPRLLAEQAIASLSALDVLVNNAAIPGPPALSTGSARTELAYQVNFLAGVMLTHFVLPALEPAGRVVNVASATHYGADLDLDDLDFRRRHYSSSGAYAQSKLAIVTYTNWLAPQLEQTVVSIHPGVVSTALLHAMFSTGGIDTSVGGANLVASLTAQVASGTYLDETTPSTPSDQSLDVQIQRALVADTSARLRTTLP
jgi:NAD(P)-dependent dehydrogenase (short-subunit alcohol dehydrogenase family)